MKNNRGDVDVYLETEMLGTEILLEALSVHYKQKVRMIGAFKIEFH